MDVSYRKIDENLEVVCAEHGKAKGINGWRIYIYIQDECLGFIAEYLQWFDVVEWLVWDADEEDGNVDEVLEGARRKFHMTLASHDLAHLYVLTANIAIMQPWMP
jgi:hypothetical protein